MNVTVLQVQVVIIECPCARACPLQSPLDDLAERLRQEMRYGRDASRRPMNLTGMTGDRPTIRETVPTQS
jgi:hypothetical protein